MKPQRTSRDRVELNLAVKALAAKDRQLCVDILARFDGAMNTAVLKTEHVAAAHAAFAEALAKLDRAP